MDDRRQTTDDRLQEHISRRRIKNIAESAVDHGRWTIDDRRQTAGTYFKKKN